MVLASARLEAGGAIEIKVPVCRNKLNHDLESYSPNLRLFKNIIL
jgi:hypothetical protein